jgi:hypothetical protein
VLERLHTTHACLVWPLLHVNTFSHKAMHRATACAACSTPPMLQCCELRRQHNVPVPTSCTPATAKDMCAAARAQKTDHNDHKGHAAKGISNAYVEDHTLVGT